ncbi:hypothetical protein EKO04_004438 [Ascochyta lentis]|uniref:Uncharacterized protein n=1 Tax=Ascochyta lentis TaxID=205686 RepID=A0A8H7J6W6_9PLEO|nr:hypothetical protein EKO04_004438 [Ascochyta lentis]
MGLQDTSPQSPAMHTTPADHHDPLYRGDLEQQATTRRSCIGKKGLWLAGGVLTTVLLVAVVVLGSALTTSNKSQEDVEVPIVANSSTLLEVQTVYSTTRATSTIFLPTPRAQVRPEAPLHPIQIETPSMTTSAASTPSDVPTGDISSSNCFFSGAWVLKEQCKKHCPAWEGHETQCEVSKRSQWVCVSCPVRA